MKKYQDFFSNLLRDDSGQDLIEYALIAGGISLAAVASITSISSSISGIFSNISTDLA